LVHAVHLPRDELQHKFGLSSRLVARLGALMAKGLGFSESVLELAAVERDMAELLLSTGILEQADALTTWKLEHLARELGLEEFVERNPLCVLEQPDARILALMDEVDAEAVWDEQPDHSAETPLAVAEVAATPAGPGVAGLVADEDVDELKLTILTSAEPKRKIEAIRKLSYARLSPNEKGKLLVSALADDSTEVRVEATRALGPLGLDPDLAVQIRELFQGEMSEKRIAARVLGRFAGEGTFLERAVTFVVVSKALGEEPFKGSRTELLEALRELSDVMVADEGFASEAAAQLVTVLADSDQTGRALARDVLARLTQASPEKMGEMLWKRLPDIDEPVVRAAFLFAIGPHLPSGIDVEEFARLVIAESLRFSELDPECWQLRVLAAGLGDDAVAPAVKMMSAVPPHARMSLFRLIDLLCRGRDLSDKSYRAVGEAVVNLLAAGSDAERVALLGLACLTESRFSSNTRQRIAAELLRELDSALMEKTLEQIDEALISLGPATLAPIIDYVKKERETPSSLRALRALGMVVTQMSSPSERERGLIESAANTCLKLISSAPPDGAPMIVLGQLCSTGLLKDRTLQRAAKLLRDSLRTSPFPFQAVEGLGWLASSPEISLQLRVEIGNSLLRLFESKLPEDLLRERQTVDGTVLDVGAEAKAYNEMLPAAIDGLRRICLASNPDSALRERIVKSFLEKWRLLNEWEEVWGPANVAALADALGDIASDPSLSRDDRARIAGALAGSLGRLSVVRALTRILLLDGDSVELGEVARSVAETLLGKRLAERGLAPEEREAILGALGAIASRRALGRRSHSLPRLRARIVSALEGALREHLGVAHEWLFRLKESDALSEFQRREIGRRLSRFQRVVPR